MELFPSAYRHTSIFHNLKPSPLISSCSHLQISLLILQKALKYLLLFPPFPVLFISAESLLMHNHLQLSTCPALSEVTNPFHFVKCTGEALVLKSQDSATGWTPLVSPSSSPAFLVRAPGFCYISLHLPQLPGAEVCSPVEAVPAPLLFFCFLSIFTSLVSSSSLMQRSFTLNLSSV